MSKITIQNGLTTKNITDLEGGVILGARFANKTDAAEINNHYAWDAHDPIILLRVRLTDGSLIELMPTADPECNGPGFIEVTPLIEVPG